MRSDVELQDFSRLDLHDDENEEDLEACGDDGEKVGGDDVGVVPDEGGPVLRGVSRRGGSRESMYLRTVRGETLRPNLARISSRMRSSPQVGVIPGRSPDEVPNVGGKVGSSEAGLPPPKESDSRSLPMDEGFGPNHDEGGPPVEEACEKSHGEPSDVVRSMDSPLSLLVEGELFAKEEDFGCERGSRTKEAEGEDSEVLKEGQPRVDEV